MMHMHTHVSLLDQIKMAKKYPTGMKLSYSDVMELADHIIGMELALDEQHKTEEQMAKWRDVAAELAGFMCADCPKFSEICSTCSAAEIHNRYTKLKADDNGR